MHKVIVFGGAGQLGQCLQALQGEYPGIELVIVPRESADILERETLEKVFEEHRPAYCINCAAYTAVDKAEDEPEAALKINREGVKNIAELCEKYSTILIHISTDFVFPGTSVQPLQENDEIKPVNIYGESKAEGEKALQEILSGYFIIRTSWLYSEFGNNFVKTMIRLGKERDELRVIWDQAGTPTYAIDLANCILTVIGTENRDFGIYHYSNEGITSWYDFAKAIFELSGTDVKVVPVRTAEYVTKAKRPQYSVLDKAKVKKNLNLEIPHWRESLVKCIEKL